MPGRRGPVIERLMRKVVVQDDGCWIWTGAANRLGYGHMGGGPGSTIKTLQTHRVTYEFCRGPIAPGLVLDHLCRVPACCNPQHLEAVTQRTNLLRGTGFPAVNARKTHCPLGHPLSGGNVQMDAGSRNCRTCVNNRQRVNSVLRRAADKAKRLLA